MDSTTMIAPPETEQFVTALRIQRREPTSNATSLPTPPEDSRRSRGQPPRHC